MPPWDPARYLTFASHRMRPAVDLIARIPLEAPRRVYDLGCGAGNVTRLLAERWPQARVVGLDSSAAMLAAARAGAPGIDFVEDDLARWEPPGPADLLFSNAALQWLPDNADVMRRLLAPLRPGGVLAVQMPRNHDAPSHREIAAVVDAHAWRDRLRPRLRPFPVPGPAAQHRNLAPLAAALDIWETEYLHVLEGRDPVAEWTRGTNLTAILEALDQAEQADFLAEYRERLRRAYPPEADGRTLFPFRRIFIVATR